MAEFPLNRSFSGGERPAALSPVNRLFPRAQSPAAAHGGSATNSAHSSAS